MQPVPARSRRLGHRDLFRLDAGQREHHDHAIAKHHDPLDCAAGARIAAVGGRLHGISVDRHDVADRIDDQTLKLASELNDDDDVA